MTADSGIAPEPKALADVLRSMQLARSEETFNLARGYVEWAYDAGREQGEVEYVERVRREALASAREQGEQFTPGASDVPGLSDEAWLAHVGASDGFDVAAGRYFVRINGALYTGPTHAAACRAARTYHGSVGTVGDVLREKAGAPKPGSFVRLNKGDNARPGDPAFVPEVGDLLCFNGVCSCTAYPCPHRSVVATSAPERVDAAVRYLRDLADAMDVVALPDGYTRTHLDDDVASLRRVAMRMEHRNNVSRAVAGVATP